MHGNSSLRPETVSDKVNTALHKIARKPVPSYAPLPAQRHRRHDSKGSRLSVQVSPKPPNALRGVISLWKWEIVSLAVSCVVFTVAIVILRAYENKGLAHWKAPISINAVIAIISTIFKGALIVPISNGISQLKWLSFSKEPQSIATMDVYDQASRGAWGSLLFLIKQFTDKRLSYDLNILSVVRQWFADSKSTDSTIAGFGALIALVTLVTEPFSQASVSIGLCQRVQSGTAIIPRHNNYIESLHTGAGSADPSMSMQLAVLTGLYSPPANSSQSISSSVICPTGNCTFSHDEEVSFTTLSMCHSCTDVTDRLVGKMGKHSTGSGPILSYSLPGYTHNLSLPNPQTATAGSGFTGLLFAFNTTQGFYIDNDTQMWADGSWSSTTALSLQGLTFRAKDGQCPTTGECALEPFAFDCGLRPCAQSFSAKVENGKYVEKELSRGYLHAVPSVFFQTTVKSAFINGNWTPCNGTQQKTANNTVFVIDATAQKLLNEGTDPSELPGEWYLPECVYHLGSGSAMALAQYIDPLFSAARLQMEEPDVYQGEAWLQMLYNYGQIKLSDVDEFMNGIALSIGAEMRRNGISTMQAQGDKGATDIPEKITGDTLHTEPCIKVKWRFLSFLAVLLAIEIVFFVAVVIINHRSPQWRENWKSSALPLLFQAVDEKELEFYNDRSSFEKFEGNLGKRAKSALVRLVEEDGEWRFIMRHEHEPLIAQDKHSI